MERGVKLLLNYHVRRASNYALLGKLIYFRFTIP